MFKRDLRTKYYLMLPDPENTVLKKQLEQIHSKEGRRKLIPYSASGDQVMVDDHRVTSNKRVLAMLQRKLSPATYVVELEPNLTWKRHVYQMILFPLNVSDQDQNK